jgi:endo-1,4-beta-xylanase
MTVSFRCRAGIAGATLLLLAGCGSLGLAPRNASLKNAFHKAFLVGAAINDSQASGTDANGAALVKRQFNTISPENVLKWEKVHPRPGVYDFTGSDRYVDFGVRNGMFVIGHTLVWHSQTPSWVFEDGTGKPVSRDTLLARMHDHIATVVGRYKGRVRGWDVVNEALNEDGTLRDSPWLRIIGPDYLVQAFRFAHEADPRAELYYNDYSLENVAKRDGAVHLIHMLLDAGVPLHAIGMQEHNKMGWPTAAQIDTAFRAFSAAGVRVNVTELDVDVLPPVIRNPGADVSDRRPGAPPGSNPYASALPDSLQLALANRYQELFAVYWAHRDVIDRVTFWGVSDRDSWLNNWPVTGRTAYPLLFDRDGKPKPAFGAVLRIAR